MCGPSLPWQPCVDAGSMLFSMMSHSGPTYHCVCAKSLQPCLTLCDAMDCSPPDSSVHGNLQARILGWIAMPSSRGSSQTRDRTGVSWSPTLKGRFFTTSTTCSQLFKIINELFYIIFSGPVFSVSDFYLHYTHLNLEKSEVLRSHSRPPHWMPKPVRRCTTL